MVEKIFKSNRVELVSGLGNLTGSFLAAAFLVLLPEALRFVGMPDSIAANMRQIIYGLILVLVMMTGQNGVKELFTSKPKLWTRSVGFVPGWW